MIKDIINIVVVTYNRINYLKTFVKFLYLSTNYPFRLIIVDNGSKDGSREYILDLEKEGRVWKHVFTSTNLPLAIALTEGYKQVESELFITAPDDIIPPIHKKADWLEIFVAKMNQDSTVGCINFVGTRCLFDKFLRQHDS